MIRVLFFCLLWISAFGDESTHRYVDGEPVTIWLGRVGPYFNPHEQYHFYSLPVCRPGIILEPETRYAGFSDLFNELENSHLPVSFRRNVVDQPICSMVLSEADTELFGFAISNHYWYQLYVDELPMWAMVGEVASDLDDSHSQEDHTSVTHDIADESFLFTHKEFSIAYNGDRIIEVNVTSGNPVLVEPFREITMTYSVVWTKTDAEFNTRFMRYLDNHFFEQKTHWFSIINSFMIVLFLCGLVALILLRTLRNDYAVYLEEETDEEMGLKSGVSTKNTVTNGWQQVHADVFRHPPHLVWYSALVGSGFQFTLLFFITIGIAFAGSLYIDNGAVQKAFIVGYIITSVFGGFMSGRFYRAFFYPKPSPEWIKVMILSGSLFPLVCLVAVIFMNSVTSYYRSSSIVPLSFILRIVALWLFISFPLHMVGTIIGRRFGAPSHSVASIRVNPLPRPIPQRPWYLSSIFMYLAAGILPFGSILMETYFLFTAFASYRTYYVFGFMILVYTILILTTSCVSVLSTYLLLNNEDYRWHWHSFFAGASTGVYVFVFSVFYFIFKTEMSGFLQSSFFFVYSALAALSVALVTGTVSATVSGIFVRAIYTAANSKLK